MPRRPGGWAGVACDTPRNRQTDNEAPMRAHETTERVAQRHRARINSAPMMGHINNMLLHMVEKHHGKGGVTRLMALAGLSTHRYHPEVIYPEAEFQALYRATKELYGVGDDAAQKAFADYFMEESPKKFPAIFKVAGGARRLLEMVPTIHKQWPSAASQGEFREKVTLVGSHPDRLVFKYDSPNRLCSVLRFVAENVLSHYGEQGTVTETQCALSGAPWCEVAVCFSPAPA